MLQWMLAVSIGLTAALQPLPPVEWSNNSTATTGFSLRKTTKIVYIDKKFADTRDTEGLTLIPPSAREFATTFVQDISSLFGGNWTLQAVDVLPPSGIILGPIKNNFTKLTYEDGIATEEGYELEITKDSVYIGGSGARGMFWGTRTLLQELLVANGSALPPGRTLDAPAYATRGYMLDAGRKWYTADFLKELCTYASFFKMSEFHYHSSDNYPLNRGHNETWNKVFSHFSLYPENNTSLQGIVQRKNETLSRAEFENFQLHCAQRGVTVIPEIEAPGHALAITKWKPALALAKKDLLNLTHPDAIPTVKAIWAEFLPWFQTKEVHIGADEYDSDLADDYIAFVNEMATFINATSGKRIRIWGTHEPSQNLTLSKDIIIQHWQYGQSDPLQLQNDGYQLINSEDWWAYMSLKNDHMPILPAPYPQFYNVSRTLNFANEQGWQWDPAMYNPMNRSMQLEPGLKGNKGAILAVWSDNGPDATTQLEGYYAMREGIAVMGARAWAGARGVKINEAELAASVKLLAGKAPGQDLDRRATIVPFSWKCDTLASLESMIGRGSYGPPYTMSLNVSGPFTLSGPDTILSLENDTLMFTTADGFPYPLRSTSILDGHDAGHPGRIWTNQSSSSHKPVVVGLPARLRLETDVQNGTRVWLNGSYVGRFEVFVFGGRNTLFSWSQMAFVAPLDKVQGGIDGITLEDGVRKGSNAGVGNGDGGLPVSNEAESSRLRLAWMVTVIVAGVVLCFV
jgi:hexosaminidase